MRIGAIAMEDEVLEITPVETNTPEDHDMDQSVAAADSAVSETSAVVSDIQEGSEIVNTTSEMIDTVQETVDSGEGLTPVTSNVVNSAMEHFYNRLQYKLDRKSAIPAMEGFKDSSSRLQSTKLALEEMKQFQAKLEKGLSVAQEGILSRMANSFSFVFTSNKKIRARVAEYEKQLKEKGSNGKLIKNPGWSRNFSKLNKSELSGADVLKHVSAVSKLLTSSETIGVFKEMAEIIEKTAIELSKGGVFAKDSAVKEIDGLHTRVSKLTGKIESLISDDVRTAKADSSFQALTPEEGEKLSKAIYALLDNKELSDAEKRLDDAIEHLDNQGLQASQLRLLKENAADMRAVDTLMRSFNSVTGELLGILHTQMKITHAAGKYIKASIA